VEVRQWSAIIQALVVSPCAYTLIPTAPLSCTHEHTTAAQHQPRHREAEERERRGERDERLTAFDRRS